MHKAKRALVHSLLVLGQNAYYIQMDGMLLKQKLPTGKLGSVPVLRIIYPIRSFGFLKDESKVSKRSKVRGFNSIP
jgi:hypothetical protein